MSETNLAEGGGEVEQTENEPRIITVGSIASWFFGIVFALVALSYVMSLNPIAFGASFVATVITLPPARRRVESAGNVRLSRWVIVGTSIVLMIVAGASM